MTSEIQVSPYSDIFPENIEALTAPEIVTILERIIDSGLVTLSGNVKDIIKLFETDPLKAEYATYESASIGFSNMSACLIGYDLGDGRSIKAKLPEEFQPQAQMFLKHVSAVFSRMYAFKFKPENRLARGARAIGDKIKGLVSEISGMYKEG